MNILIVDDDFVSRNKMNLILTPYGRCEMALNGKECVDAFLRAHEKGKPYDLITLDIQMPGIDGIETLKKIREWEKENQTEFAKRVKVIMVTVKDDMKTVFSSFREGCESYVPKPFDRESIAKALAGLKIGKKET